MAEPDCPKCRAKMEPGFVVDRGDYGSVGASEWAEGPPEKSMWTGVKLRGKERRRIDTYRCAQCGYLEFYAP
jgi:Domain of unknown function (DUF6487)